MRLDAALPARDLARSRNQASQLIRAGQVLVDGDVVTRASHPVGDDADIRVLAQPWVSRAAHKLLGALDASGTDVPSRVLDAGASTGGFTQVCLSRGAEAVYAVDVGHDQLAAELRQDPRVHVREGLNLRELQLAHLDDAPVDLVVGDVSFISLTLLMPTMLAVLHASGTALLLVKPQFEVGRDRLGAGGVVRSDEDREAAVARVVATASDLGWRCDWQGRSPLPGQSGNVEFFVRLTR